MTDQPANLPWTRVFYWTVRREIWEHRAIYIAPVAIAGVALFGFLLSLFRLPHAVRVAGASAKAADGLMTPYSFVAMAVMATGFLVGIFYCLSALHGERQDRSIQFWKSLPVSDTVTVLAKAAVPLVVIPVVVFAVIAAAQLTMLLLSTLVVLANGMAPGMLWAHVGLGLMWLVLPYGLVINALWHAPLYAWLLLVSGWAKRMTFLWAFGPLLALCGFERLAFNSTHLIRMLGERVVGGYGAAFSIKGQGRAPVDRLADLDPAGFLATPGLWIGLVVAALLLFAAIRLRRSRDPI
jgi:ABC-2 type transport system permease protein